MSVIYEALRLYVVELKRERTLGSNDRLPSERQLLSLFDASRITIREALFRLESEGLIYRLNRKGWFLAGDRLIIQPSHKINFNQVAFEQGRLAGTKVLGVRKIKPRALIRKTLDLGNGGSVIEIIRCRSLDGRPVLIESVYLSNSQFEGITRFNLNESISPLQKKHFDIRVQKEHCTIRVETLGELYAEHLEVTPAMPAIRIERTRYAKGKPVDFNIEYWLHNAIELSIATC